MFLCQDGRHLEEISLSFQCLPWKVGSQRKLPAMALAHQVSPAELTRAPVTGPWVHDSLVASTTTVAPQISGGIACTWGSIRAHPRGFQALGSLAQSHSVCSNFRMWESWGYWPRAWPPLGHCCGPVIGRDAQETGAHQGHSERPAHDCMEEVMCGWARHHEEFTDEKILAAGVV